MIGAELIHFIFIYLIPLFLINLIFIFVNFNNIINILLFVNLNKTITMRIFSIILIFYFDLYKLLKLSIIIFSLYFMIKLIK